MFGTIGMDLLQILHSLVLVVKNILILHSLIDLGISILEIPHEYAIPP